MTAQTIASPAESADFVTTLKHISTITSGLGEIASVCSNLDHDANASACAIESTIREARPVERKDLEAAKAVIDQFDDVVAKLHNASTDAWVSLQVLLGNLRHAANGDLVGSDEAGFGEAVSEAIV